MRSLLRRLRSENGFTMVNIMVVMTAVMGISVAAYAATGSDLRIGVFDKSQKQAYAAAEAGVAEYMHRLNLDNAYWRLCANRPDVPTHIGQRWSGAGTDPRVWRQLPDAPGEYTIELLPANGEPACDPTRTAQSMLDLKTGAFQIRVTGRVRRNGKTESKRSLISTFKRTSFLEFLYFTDYETIDPFVQQIKTWGKQTRPKEGYTPDRLAPTVLDWASSECEKHFRDGRAHAGGNYDKWFYTGDGDGTPDDGRIYWPDSDGSDPWKLWYSYCDNNQFGVTDVVDGPLHTNDDLYVCGTPDFGRVGRNDKIEVSAPAPGVRKCNSSAAPNFRGDFKTSARELPLPPNNTAIKKVALPGYLYTGTTTIVLGANTLTINGVSKAYPSNGVIYVESGACGQSYQPLAPMSAPAGCGDVYVSGEYNKDLTIAARKDIIVTNNVTRQNITPKPDVTLGLIADGFVRVGHPIVNNVPNTNVAWESRTDRPSCTNDFTGTRNITIEAAILALNHSFMVDSYYCGSPLGTLTVFGVIAQKFRGPVGVGGAGNPVNGYIKAYSYDDRLSLRQPPYFLDPVQSAWRLRRQTEQTPAR